MKILVISNLYPPHEIGGYEIRCRDIMERIRERGHDVRVLTSDHHVSGREEFEQPHVTRKLRIHGFFGHPWLPIQKLYALERHNHAALQNEIDQFKPDLIHVWNMGGISKSLLHRVENTGITVVYDISDHWIARSIAGDVWLSWWNDTGSSGRQFARRAAEVIGLRKKIDPFAPTASSKKLRFKNIYFCSAFMRDHTVSKGWPVGHAAVIHCGIDTGGFKIKSDHSNFAKLLWVGRLSDDKDPLTAVRALASAHQAGLTHLTLDLYGKGDAAYTEQLKSEIAKHHLGEQINIRLASAAEMRGLYSQYDALLFTSNWGEPFALTPLEAMASGLPVITSLDGGQAELARDRDNCLIAAAAQPDLYAEKIAELAASPELRESIAANGLSEVRQKFDLEPITHQIEQFLQAAKGS